MRVPLLTVRRSSSSRGSRGPACSPRFPDSRTRGCHSRRCSFGPTPVRACVGRVSDERDHVRCRDPRE